MNPSPTELDQLRLATAWDWLLRLRDESISQSELAAWLNWYETDARNKNAYEEVRALWQQAGRLVEGADPLPAELWLDESAPARTARLPSWDGLASWASHRSVWAAATLSAVLLAVLIVLTTPSPSRPPTVAIAPNLVRPTYLPDGSRVDLAAKSSVTLQFTDKQRLLTMQQGAAYFTVAHNRERPFVVKAGKLYVRAVGTAFNIRNAGERVVVTVTEGSVAVYPEPPQKSGQAPGSRLQSADEPPAGAIRVGAGREVTWAATAPGPTIAAVDPSHALAWRQGRLDYLNEPLASAIADINRYSQRQILIRDAEVGQIIFSGTVLTDATDDWIKALPGLFPVQVLSDAQGNVVLASR